MSVRPLRGVVAVLLPALVLAGCAAGGSGGSHLPGAVESQGYVSADGATKQWPAGQRKGPVELSGTDFEGTQQDLASWRGDVVVVNTWYANCPPCRKEAPDLAAIAKEYAGKGVHFVGVNGTDDAGAAQAFQRRFAVPYPSIDDARGAAVAALQGIVPVNAVPTTLVLDRDGKVAGRILGTADPSTLRGMLDDVVAETA